MHEIPSNLDEAIREAWRPDVARASIERWETVCQQEQWPDTPKNLPLLASVFGASWYLTRYIFFRGRSVARLFDRKRKPSFTQRAIDQRLRRLSRRGAADDRMDPLRAAKNEILLEVLIADLQGQLDQEAVEGALTHLAESSLCVAAELVAGDGERVMGEFAVLGMGRLAGYEINYGSDLDLILLALTKSDRRFTKISRHARQLLQAVSEVTPLGQLYEIDMRLRPHGTAGVLVTELSALVKHHTDERDIWERQMMTRCRAVLDSKGRGGAGLSKIRKAVYGDYPRDGLALAIQEMRARVEKELGSPLGKYDLKKGYGGIMDIDFLTHYLQLAYGAEIPELRRASTREALRAASTYGLLDGLMGVRLLQANDFLKTVEGRLRVFDMKPLHTFPREGKELAPLARALSSSLVEDADESSAIERFFDKYRQTTAFVRECFNEVVR